MPRLRRGAIIYLVPCLRSGSCELLFSDRVREGKFPRTLSDLLLHSSKDFAVSPPKFPLELAKHITSYILGGLGLSASAVSARTSGFAADGYYPLLLPLKATECSDFPLPGNLPCSDCFVCSNNIIIPKNSIKSTNAKSLKKASALWRERQALH